MINILDTGIQNVGSLSSALNSLSIEHYVSQANNFQDNDFSHLIIPGVGSFDAGATGLLQDNLSQKINSEIKNGTFVLGICLGMQLLFSESAEGLFASKGLNIFQAKVDKLPRNDNNHWPHIGWSSVKIERKSRLFENIDDLEDFYFIHGYAAAPGENTVATSSFGVEFSAAIERENVFGVQFHPEKSQQAGLQLLKNFSRLRE